MKPDPQIGGSRESIARPLSKNVSQTSQYRQEGKQKVVTSRFIYNPLQDKKI